MNTPQEFLSELEKDLLKADPMDRHKITSGYAAHMEAREAAIRKEAYIKGGIDTIKRFSQQEER